MTRRMLVILLGSVTALTLASRLCFTRAMWNDLVSRPAELRRAVIAEDGRLVAEVSSSAGSVTLVAPIAAPDAFLKVRDALVLDEDVWPVAATAVEILPDRDSDYATGPAPPAGLSIGLRGLPRRGVHRATLHVRSADESRDVDIQFRLPIDWTDPAPYTACLLTPFTWVVDLGAVPIRLFLAGAATLEGRPVPSVWCSD